MIQITRRILLTHPPPPKRATRPRWAHTPLDLISSFSFIPFSHLPRLLLPSHQLHPPPALLHHWNLTRFSLHRRCLAGSRAPPPHHRIPAASPEPISVGASLSTSNARAPSPASPAASAHRSRRPSPPWICSRGGMVVLEELLRVRVGGGAAPRSRQ
jgi:hypothetical protein